MADKNGFTEKHKKIMAAAAVIIFIVLTAVVCWFIGRPVLKFVGEPELFRYWVEQRGFLGRAAYVGMVLLQVFIAIIPGEPLEISGGYAFGAVDGTLLCLLGASVGSIVVFLFVRRFGIKVVEVFFPREKIQSLRFLKSTQRRNILFLLIFMIPGTPKDLLCYFAGITDIKLGVWVLISSLGRIPSIITSTIGGDALGVENYVFAVVVFVVTFAISIGGILVYNYICKKHSRE